MTAKSFISVTGLLILLFTAGRTNRQSASERYYYWTGQEGEEIVYQIRGNVFRGEYVDPAFQDRLSIPVVGMIDREGNVDGVAAILLPDGNLYAMIKGKIAGDTFKAEWLATDDLRSMTLYLKKLPSATTAEIDKHPDAFYNSLFPGYVYGTSFGMEQSRVIPFMPANTFRSRTYGYRIGEWTMKYIHISPTENEGEVNFQIHLEEIGQYEIVVDMAGTASLKNNRFRYKEKNYEFEVTVYNGFVVIETLAGVIEPGGATDSMDAVLTADGVYPLSLGTSFYMEQGQAVSEREYMENKIKTDILSMPEMAFEHAAVLIVDVPSEKEPYYTVKAGSNMDSHFATSYWFHVYAPPEYEIRVYDVISDSEISLQEWRGSVGGM